MKKRKILWLCLTLFMTSPALAGHFILTPYYFYKTHLYFNGTNRYNEAYSGIGGEFGYEPLSFLAFSLSGEYGSLGGVKREVDTALEAYFPFEKAERNLSAFRFSTQLFFYSSPENVFYGGFGFGGVFLKNIFINRVEYPGTDQSQWMWHAFVGDRFLLFPSMIFQIEADFSSNFKKIGPVFGGSPDFNQYFITLRMGIGALF